MLVSGEYLESIQEPDCTIERNITGPTVGLAVWPQQHAPSPSGWPVSSRILPTESPASPGSAFRSTPKTEPTPRIRPGRAIMRSVTWPSSC